VQVQADLSLLWALDLVQISSCFAHSEGFFSSPHRRIALAFRAESMYSKQARFAVQERIESLVAQMHRGGILYREAVCEFKKAFVSAALRDNKGNVSKTAPILGLHRNTLARICFELELDVRDFRPGSRRPPKSAHAALVPKRAAR
jgi:DNA-binding NtrC family response regulator